MSSWPNVGGTLPAAMDGWPIAGGTHPGNSVGVALPQPRVEVLSASTLGIYIIRWSNAEPKVTGAALCDAER